MPRSRAWRTTRVNSLTPSRVWSLAWPLPWLPVPMPTSETWTPLLPRVTLSVGLLGRLARAASAVVAEADAARAVVAAVDRARKSRRFRGVMARVLRWFRFRTVLKRGRPASGPRFPPILTSPRPCYHKQHATAAAPWPLTQREQD